MKKTALLAFLVVSAVFLSGCASGDQAATKATENNALLQKDVALPTRASEINGVVASIEGNEIIIKKEIGQEVLTQQQMDQKKADRQKLSETERQALRASELAGVKTEDTKLTIPVGVPIWKADGTGTGVSVKAELNDIKKGSYLSIWTSGGNMEAVKIKGLN